MKFVTDWPEQMFVAIVGTRASGKSSVAQYLVEQKAFHLVKLIMVRLLNVVFVAMDDRQAALDIRTAVLLISSRDLLQKSKSLILS